MSEALATPNPRACTLISICRNCEALLLSAACAEPIRDRQSKPVASLARTAELISAVDGGSLELSMLRPRTNAMKMSESIRKNLQVVLILKAHPHTGGDVVGGIVGASEFTIVVSVHGNAVVKQDGSACSD
jgi:hypothetical protein